MNYICMDLELEQPKSNPQCTDSLLDHEKIIQVGWCVFNSITEEFHTERLEHIYLGVPLSSFIKKLTGISDNDLNAGVSLPEVYEMIKSDRIKYDASRIIIQWGYGDSETLKKELSYPEDWPFGKSGLNVKHLFRTYCDARNINSSGGLKKSMKKAGLRFEGGAHNALVDAKNTTKMYLYLRSLYGV